MKNLAIAAMGLALLALVVAVGGAVFAIWPVVTDAPWEAEEVVRGGRMAEIRCEGALRLRESATEAIGLAPPRLDIEDYLWGQLERAELEIREYCQ